MCQRDRERDGGLSCVTALIWPGGDDGGLGQGWGLGGKAWPSRSGLLPPRLGGAAHLAEPALQPEASLLLPPVPACPAVSLYLFLFPFPVPSSHSW